MRRLVGAALGAVAPALGLRLTDPDRHALGRLGEALVARTLARRGWTVEGRRVRTPAGELDLVATRAGELLVVEVKTRRAPRGAVMAHLPYRPGESVPPAGRRRLARATALLARRLGQPRWRLVLAEVCAPRRGAPQVHLDVVATSRSDPDRRVVSFTALDQPNR